MVATEAKTSYSSCVSSCSSHTSSSVESAPSAAVPSTGTIGSSGPLPFPFDFAVVQSKKPGKLSGGISYTQLIGRAVRKKWTTPEAKEEWYTKFTNARRRKTTKMFHLQGGLCYFCGQKSWLPGDTPISNNRRATLEHIVCQGKGGTDHLSNVVMSCSGCNNLRGDMKFNKFLKLRQNPEAWRVYCKMKAARLQEKKVKVKEKRKDAKNLLMWKIAVLLYVKPEWQQAVDEVRAEMARRWQVIEDRRLAKIANSSVDPKDLV